MANKKLTELSSLTSIADADLLYSVDVSDTTDGPSGTSKKLAASTLRGYAGMASFTVANDDDRLNTNWGSGNVKFGDVVFVISTGLYYQVIDTNHLDSDMGYAVLAPAGDSLIQFRQGTQSEVNSITPLLGEPVVVTGYPYGPILKIGDGVTLGGKSVGTVVSFPVSGEAPATYLPEYTGFSLSYFGGKTGVLAGTRGAGAIELSTFHSDTGQGALGTHSLAIGNSTAASGIRTIAFGSEAGAVGMNSIALGTQTRSFGNNSFALGLGAYARQVGSTAIGYTAAALGKNSVSFGVNVLGHQPSAVNFGGFDSTCGFITCGTACLHNYVDGATLTELTTDGFAAGGSAVANFSPVTALAYQITTSYDNNFIVLPTFGAAVGGSVYEADITVVGHNYQTNDACVLRRRVLLVNNATAWSMVGSVQTIGTDIASAGASTWSTTITVDDANKKLAVKAQASAGAFAFFSARVEFTLMSWWQ